MRSGTRSHCNITSSGVRWSNLRASAASRAADSDSTQRKTNRKGEMTQRLCLLFNSMLRHSFVPSDFRFGLIKPVLKDKNGDITSTDMYRPITLTPVISKLFESVLNQNTEH